MVSTTAGDIFVQMRGPDAGRAVLFIPGTAAWSGFWLSVADEIGKSGYRAVAVDLPPFGFSARSANGAYSRADQAERLAALVQALGLERPIVVGHSFGAGAVVELAIAHPDTLGGMVLVDAALGLPGEGQDTPPDNRPLRWALNQPAIAQTLVAATLVNIWATRPLLASLLYREDAATQRQVEILTKPYARQGTTESYAHWLPSLLLAETDARSATPANYARIKTPTALIWGDRDQVTPLAQGQRLQKLIAGSTLDTIADVGHIPHIEDEQTFLSVLKAKLKAMAR
ncbi:alpha/beta fold hydrolase [Methylocapsa sp. S129]|uniref:alpha/beta fold hydrolase n=1 Tax=Methylocapsa sp. S129 TaxID=1641869 RepID=UPI00131BC8B4|nr:alpha/beta hydrolase [Methylocapsa sp. S129]